LAQTQLLQLLVQQRLVEKGLAAAGPAGFSRQRSGDDTGGVRRWYR
jgi:hypothetical protein